MSLIQKFSLQQQIKLSLTPSLKQAIELLSFSADDLDAQLTAWKESNPFFDFTYPPASDHDCDFLENVADEQRCPMKKILEESLIHAHLSPELWEYAIELIESLDENGFCPEDVYRSFSASIQKKIDDWLISVEPIGIGARSVRQCLHWQILYSAHINLKASQREHLVLLLSDDTRDIREISSCLHHLNQKLYFYPSSVLECGQSERIDRSAPPDLITQLNPHTLNFEVYLNPAIIPQIHITSWPLELSKKNDCRKLYQEALFLGKMVSTRFATLLLVAKKIVEKQQDFFKYGEIGLQPLILNDIATLVELHESTISRVIQNKSILTPQGHIELKKMFSRSLKKKTSASISDRALKQIVKKTIEIEPKDHPYSDQALAKILNKQGFCIARRTIAKYREELGIANSHERAMGNHLNNDQ